MILLAPIIIVVTAFLLQKNLTGTQTYEVKNLPDLVAIDNSSSPAFTNANWFIASDTPYGTSTPYNANQFEKKLTATEQLSHDILIKYIELKNSGNFSSSTLNDLSQELASQLLNTITIKAIGVSDLNVTTNENHDSVKKYMDTMGTILIKDSPKKPANEIALLSDILKNNDPTATGKLKPIVQNYQNLASDFTSVKVPAGIADSQVDLINNLLLIAKSVDSFKLVLSDPASGLAAIQQYKKSILSVQIDVANFQAYASLKGATPQPGEPGDVFINAFGII